MLRHRLRHGVCRLCRLSRTACSHTGNDSLAIESHRLSIKARVHGGYEILVGLYISSRVQSTRGHELDIDALCCHGEKRTVIGPNPAPSRSSSKNRPAFRLNIDQSILGRKLVRQENRRRFVGTLYDNTVHILLLFCPIPISNSPHYRLQSQCSPLGCTCFFSPMYRCTGVTMIPRPLVGGVTFAPPPLPSNMPPPPLCSI